MATNNGNAIELNIVTAGALAAGAGLTPSLFLAGDTTTGWYRNAANQWTFSANGIVDRISLINGLIRLGSNMELCWTASTSVAAADTGLIRSAAGVVEVNNGTTGQRRDLYARNLRTEATTVASLVAAATAGAGARSFVTDADATTFGAAAVGGGANAVPVWSDGTAWKIG